MPAPTLRYADGAVADLLAYLQANLPAAITTVAGERQAALAAVNVFRAAIHPFGVEALAVEVECESSDVEDLHNRYWYHGCLVHIVYRAPDADVVAAQVTLRAYVSALLQCLMTDPTITNTNVDAQPQNVSYSQIPTGPGSLLLVATAKVTVKRQEP